MADWQALFERSDETTQLFDYQPPPLTKWRVHLTLREFRFSLTAFLRALLLANHWTVPSLRMNINPVPGSITSPEKVQILCSGISITYS